MERRHCDYDNTIGWDRGLLPSLRKANGDMAITMVPARIRSRDILRISMRKKTLVSEQQADCFAGVYVRWVAEATLQVHHQHRRRFEQPAGRNDLVPRSAVERGRLLRRRRRARFGLRTDPAFRSASPTVPPPARPSTPRSRPAMAICGELQ